MATWPWSIAFLFFSFLRIINSKTFHETPLPSKKNQPASQIDCSLPLYAMLGTPSSSAITAKLMTEYPGSFKLVFESDKDSGESGWTNIVPYEVSILTFEGLQPNTKYSYFLVYRYDESSCGQLMSEPKYFSTKRNSGETFRFAISADTHLNDRGAFEGNVFLQTLANMKKSAVDSLGLDFWIDMGDTFMGRKSKVLRSDVLNPYETIFKLFSLVGSSAPVFFVNGNHDGESGYMLENYDSSSGLASPLDFVLARKQYFSVPQPWMEGYSTNSDEEYMSSAGFLGNYYSWEWGNSLFVVLDPYWYTYTRTDRSGWEWTLGKEQYDWLAEVLTNSGAAFKFIFIHQYVGGVFGTARGFGGNGDQSFANYFEWGGLNQDGSYGFNEKRPGWIHGPIHNILVANRVSVVFRGHDHLFHIGSVDGIIYHTLPKTSIADTIVIDSKIRDKGYNPREVALMSGHAEITVSSSTAQVEFTKYTGEKIHCYDIQMSSSRKLNIDVHHEFAASSDFGDADFHLQPCFALFVSAAILILVFSLILLGTLQRDAFSGGSCSKLPLFL